jgi:predicted DNA-binding transcriptional regulator AlpA
VEIENEGQPEQAEPERRAVSPDLRAALKLVASALPPGATISIERDQLLALLDGEHASLTPDSTSTRLLDAEAAADRLGMSKVWLYRNAAQLPFARKVGRSLRFDADGIDRWLARRSPLQTGSARARS